MVTAIDPVGPDLVDFFEEPVMSAKKPPGHSRWGILLTIIGRFVAVIGFTVVGLYGGLAYGVYRAIQDVAALPPAPARSAGAYATYGFVPVVVTIVDVLLGAIGGTVIGTVIGVLYTIIVRPRYRAR